MENLNREEDNDEGLCWAAATANILHYTGWGQEAGFGSTDYLFDLFTTRFSDAAGNPYYGLPWFFNGYYAPQGLENWSQVDDGSYGTFQGYLPQYPAETVMEFLSLENGREALADAAGLLRKGCGVSLAIALYQGEEFTGGHAITLWGYVRDKNDSGGFSYLIVSDSDSDNAASSENRRGAPNKLAALGLETHTLRNRAYWAFSDYSTGPEESAILIDATALTPFSAGLPKETEGDGNRFVHPDLMVESLGVDTLPDTRLYGRKVLPAGQELFVQFNAMNFSVEAAGGFAYQITVGKDGGKQTTLDGSFDEPPYAPTQDLYASVSAGSLDPGRYTVTVTVNPDKSFTEANYLNNTKTVSFTVAEGEPAGELAVILGDMGNQEDGSVGAVAALERPADCPANAAQYSLYTAYGNDEIETGWTTQYTGKTFPAELFTERNVFYRSVFYRLLVNTGDPARPWLEFLSGSVAQRYRFIEASAVDGNCETLTAIPEGSTSYAAGESTRFCFYNGSVVPGCLAFDWGLWAVGETGGEYCLAMGRGEPEPAGNLSPEPNTSLAIIDPETGEPTGETLPAGRYRLCARAEYTDLLGGTETSEAEVGTITVTPTGDLPRLTTGEPVSVGATRATVSAAAQVEPGTMAHLGVEFSTDEDFACAAAFWFTEELSESSGTVSDEYEIHPLLPERKYYYRAVLEARDGDGVKTWRDENVKSLETNRPDHLEELTPAEELRFSQAPREWYYLVFTPPESGGWYHISASGSYAMDYFVEGDNAWYSGQDDYMYFQDGRAAFNCKIPAGRQMCISIISLEEADCTVSITRLESSVTDYVVDAPALTEDGDGVLRATVSAAVPLGSSFTLGVEYGPNGSALTNVSEDFTGWRTDSAQAAFRLNVRPGQSFTYRAFVRDAGTEETVYSETRTAEVPPFSGALLPEGTRTLTLERNETRSFYSYTAETAGTYVFRIDGPDGVLTCWDRGWTNRQFTSNGAVVTVPLDPGETAYFTLRAYSPGEYHLSTSFTGKSRTQDANGFVWSFVPEVDGLCFAAVYDEDGKMLSVRRETMTAGERCTVSAPVQAGQATMKVFQVSETMVPLCEPAVIQ